MIGGPITGDTKTGRSNTTTAIAKAAQIQTKFSTGRMPTALYALDAKAIGQAWTIGGRKGSDRLAVEMLALMPCEDIGSGSLNEGCSLNRRDSLLSPPSFCPTNGVHLSE